MSRASLSSKQMIAFKIGARARKFALEGCPIEGYELLYTALAETETADSDLHTLLQTEFTKYETRLAAMEEEVMSDFLK